MAKIKNNKGCGRMLAMSEDSDCGAYCNFCKEFHFCVFCGGEYELHRIELSKIEKDIKKEKLKLKSKKD